MIQEITCKYFTVCDWQTWLSQQCPGTKELTSFWLFNFHQLFQAAFKPKQTDHRGGLNAPGLCSAVQTGTSDNATLNAKNSHRCDRNANEWSWVLKSHSKQNCEIAGRQQGLTGAKLLKHSSASSGTRTLGKWSKKLWLVGFQLYQWFQQDFCHLCVKHAHLKLKYFNNLILRLNSGQECFYKVMNGEKCTTNDK